MREPIKNALSDEQKQARVDERVAIIHAELAKFPSPDAVAPGVIHFLAACFLSARCTSASEEQRLEAIALAQDAFQTCCDDAAQETARVTGREGIVDTRLILERVSEIAAMILAPRFEGEEKP